MARAVVFFPWPGQRVTVTMRRFRTRRPGVLKSTATWLLFRSDKYINCFGETTPSPPGLCSTSDRWPTGKNFSSLLALCLPAIGINTTQSDWSVRQAKTKNDYRCEGETEKLRDWIWASINNKIKKKPQFWSTEREKKKKENKRESCEWNFSTVVFHAQYSPRPIMPLCQTGSSVRLYGVYRFYVPRWRM